MLLCEKYRLIHPFYMYIHFWWILIRYLTNCAACIYKYIGGGGGWKYIHLIRKPYAIVFHIRTYSICEKKIYERIYIVYLDINVSWIEQSQCIKIHDTSWFAKAILLINFTYHSNFGSFLFHSAIATSSTKYQLMVLLINILLAKKNYYPRDICSSKISYPLGFIYQRETYFT